MVKIILIMKSPPKENWDGVYNLTEKYKLK